MKEVNAEVVVNEDNNDIETFVPAEKRVKSNPDIEGPKISAPQAPHA